MEFSPPIRYMWVMELCISRRQHDQLLKWANDADDRECCGLLLGQDAHVQKMVLANNVAPQPITHFEIDPGTLITAEKEARGGGLSVLGYFHSHPKGVAQPSHTDAETAAVDGRFWVIIALDTMTGWHTTENGTVHGKFNPVALVIDDDAQG